MGPLSRPGSRRSKYHFDITRAHNPCTAIDTVGIYATRLQTRTTTRVTMIGQPETRNGRIHVSLLQPSFRGLQKNELHPRYLCHLQNIRFRLQMQSLIESFLLKNATLEPLQAMVPCLEPVSKKIKNQKLHTLCTINYII